MIALADLSWGHAFGLSLGFCSRTVPIGATDVEGFIAAVSAKTRINICRQNTTNNVAKMGGVVDVGKCRSDKFLFGFFSHSVSSREPTNLELILRKVNWLRKSLCVLVPDNEPLCPEANDLSRLAGTTQRPAPVTRAFLDALNRAKKNPKPKALGKVLKIF